MKATYTLKIYNRQGIVIGRKAYCNKREIITKAKDIVYRHEFLYQTSLYACMRELATGIRIMVYMKKGKIAYCKLGG